MKVGICFPMTMQAPRQRNVFLDWCKAVDRSGLSTIALGERIAYHAQDPLIALAAACGVTERVRLMTSVAVLPLRNTGLLAKELSTLDILSGGRFVFGVGIGNRPGDFSALDAQWSGRAHRMETQIKALRSIWRGEGLADGVPPIGPAPLSRGGPPVIYGAMSDVALRRAGHVADGVITWSMRPDATVQMASIRTVEQAWRESGRSGRPYIVAAMYFSLGAGAEEMLKSHLAAYYSYSQEARARIADVRTYTAAAVAETMKSYADAGVDELLFGPPTASTDQIGYLAEIASRLGYSA
ncbi:MAG: LLM class flavin-dependent oxidoreductase [Steroidobacteraceae bacterium]